MKHLKVTSALLSAVMCMSMVATPVAVMADETSVPEETQAAEVAEKEESKETEKAAPKETEKPEEKEEEKPAETEKQEPEQEEKKPETAEEQPLEDEDSKDAEYGIVYKGKCGKKLKWTLSDAGVLTVSGKGAMYNYDENTGLDDGTFQTPWGGYLITKVVIGKGVTTIGTYAFDGMYSITSVSLPSTLTKIGDYAFQKCYGLKAVTIPKNVTKIGEYAFCGCSGLQSIAFPSKVKTLGCHAFRECTGLKSVTIPKTLTSIDIDAFLDCTGLEKAVFAEGVTKVPEGIFYGCTKLTDITLPKSLKSIEHQAFYGCTSLKEIKMPKSLRIIGSQAFCRCTSLTTVSLELNGLTKIGSHAFYFCKALEVFFIPITVTTIESSAFFDCTSLATVLIDKKLQASLDNSVFDKCPVTFTNYPYASLGEEFKVNGLDYRITYAAYDGTGTVALIGTADNTEQTLVVPNVVTINSANYKVTSIGSNAFSYDQNMLALVIGSNVLTIDYMAFYACSELRSVTGGANLRSIGDEAFANCRVLKTFKITSTALWKIGKYAFSSDSSLKTLYLKKTTKLTKSGVKNSLKYSKVKTVKVKKSKVKKYKKIFKKSNSGRKVKVKK